MSNLPNSQLMADLTVQLPEAPLTTAQRRARFFNSGNAFNIKLPPVPPASFNTHAALALDSDVSATFECDQSGVLNCEMAATTPLMLARYLSLATDDEQNLSAPASQLICFVITGTGYCRDDDEVWEWGPGDVLLLPGEGRVSLGADANGALLWLGGNDPLLAFEKLRGSAESIEPVHYTAAEIRRQLSLLATLKSDANTSGTALIFSSETLEAERNITPSLTLSFNTLAPDCTQRAHRHNSAAITLIVQGDGCYSMIDKQHCKWQQWTTMVTPPGSIHSHHNLGNETALFLIVQDGGLHYHARTMGFEFVE